MKTRHASSKNVANKQAGQSPFKKCGMLRLP